jgi:flagellar basal body-associated protein FliL
MKGQKMSKKKVEALKPPVPPVAPKTPMEDKTKGIGIAAVILAVVMPFIGLILGIVGLVMSGKVKNATGQKAKGRTPSLVAVILAPILMIVYTVLFVVVIVGAVFFLLGSAREDLAGTWTCKDSHDIAGVYGTQTFMFTNDGDFRVELDSDPENDFIAGRFRISSLNIDMNNRRYVLNVDFDGYSARWNAVIPSDNRGEMRINFEDSGAVVCRLD